MKTFKMLNNELLISWRQFFLPLLLKPFPEPKHKILVPRRGVFVGRFYEGWIDAKAVAAGLVQFVTVLHILGVQGV